MVKAVRMHETGGPSVLKFESVDPGRPGPGEALVRHAAVGVNFIDIYHRTGLYPLPKLPAVIGLEGAGTVEAVGEGVTEVAPGDRVAYATGPLGAYTEARRIPAEKLVKLPDDVPFEQAGGMMLRGLTVEYLIRRCFRVEPGMTVLVHAAAGGVGSLAVQWLKALGAVVIGTVGSDEKAEIVRALGCDHPVVYTREDFVKRVQEITGGKGVPVVYDSVGKTTLAGSLDCLAPRGMLVSFGNASGKPDPLDLLDLSRKGSLYVTRPTLFHYTAKREELVEGARALFEVVRSGVVRVGVRHRYPLAEAAKAHEDLEGRRTVGPVVLIP